MKRASLIIVLFFSLLSTSCQRWQVMTINESYTDNVSCDCYVKVVGIPGGTYSRSWGKSKWKCDRSDREPINKQVDSLRNVIDTIDSDSELASFQIQLDSLSEIWTRIVIRKSYSRTSEKLTEKQKLRYYSDHKNSNLRPIKRQKIRQETTLTN